MPFRNGILHDHSSHSVPVFNLPKIYAMYYWSDYFPCCCRVNISELTDCTAVSWSSFVSRVRIPNILIATLMWDTKSLNPSLFEVMVSSQINVPCLTIGATILCKSSSMLGWLQWMNTRICFLLGIILDMCCHGDSIYTVELRNPAALVSFVSFVIKFFRIHPKMGRAQWGITRWQKLTSQCETNWHSQRTLNWVVWIWMKQLWPFWGWNQVEESQ